MLLYGSAFTTVVILDALCVKYVLLPLFRGTYATNVRMSFIHALVGTLIAALLIGIVLLEGGANLAVPVLVLGGMREAVAITLVKNSYATLAPLLNATYLVFWARWILKFRLTWSAALVGGVILHNIDHSVVVPWFFHLAKALAVT